MRNWKRLIVGECIENKRGEITSWRLLAEPWSAGKGSMSRVKVQCVECGGTFTRRLSNIIQGTSRRCSSCAARARYQKARAASG